jgi:hypothetical protein
VTEPVSKLSKGWKVWKNPTRPEEGPEYLGEVFAPEDRFCLAGADLRELGFGPGEYTVLAPEQFPHNDMFGRWQSVTLPPW